MRDWTPDLEQRLASLRLDPAREAEIVEELSEHLDQRYAELRDRGVDEAAAVALVRAELLDDDALARLMRPLRQANAPPPVVPIGAPRRRVAGPAARGATAEQAVGAQPHGASDACARHWRIGRDVLAAEASDPRGATRPGRRRARQHQVSRRQARTSAVRACGAAGRG